jgi:GT2 family glycosyltransferase
VVAAPSVVVVLVVHDPGWWFEETLTSLAAQEYSNLSVLVVDAASADGDAVRGRVAAVLPSAHLRRLEVNDGFGMAANEALKAVQGAAFYLLCHDDVRLEPDAVQVMVEEAFRSNAGMVGPKLVDWRHADQLLSVGMGADRFGQPAPYVERGDLDQAQHDAVRDVFYLPGAVTLVRADLFEALGGFDPAITYHGDDLDLGWRAHVAGARVVVAPAARVAHLEALGQRRPIDDRRRLQARHRLRVVRVADRAGTRLRVVPVAFLLALLEVVHAIVHGRLRHAGDITSAWIWTVRTSPSARHRRHHLATVRRAADRDVRALQARGSARLSSYLRGQLGGDGASGPRDVVSNLRDARTATSVVVWTLVAVFLVVGSRELLTGSLPAIGELVPFDPPADLFSRWMSGYDATGLGANSPNATGLGMFGGLGALLLGATGFLRTVVILAPLLLGVLGVARLAKPLGSRRARLVAVVAYAAVPVGTNALSTGRWAGIVAYGLAPWVLSALAGASDVAPYGVVGGSAGPGIRHRPLSQRIVAVGLVVAVAAAVDASLLLVLPLCGLALVLGGLLAGQLAGAGRILAATVGGTVVAVVLHLPWSLSFLDGWPAVVSPTSTAGQSLDLAAVVRFDTGPLGSGPLGWLLLVAALLPLLIGRRWRVSWAVRGWAVAVAGFAVAWVEGQGWFAVALPAPEVLLAPAAAALALSIALGMVAFEVDLPDYHFGWRQIVSLLAGAAFAIAVVPAVGTAVSGRWELPAGDYQRSLAFMREEAEQTPFRALWLGDAGVLPGVGWELDAPGVDDLGPDRALTYLTSTTGVPTLAERWAGAPSDATGELAATIRSAAAGDTARLGALLAPMGVRYVVVPLAPAPAPFGDGRRYDPADLLAMLDGQLDLDRLTVNPGVRVYRNAAWGPIRAALPPGTQPGAGATDFESRTLPALAGAPVALPEAGGVTDAEGTVEPGVVYLADAAGEQWRLEVDGTTVERSDAFGWASAFTVPASGSARLTYSTPAARLVALVVQVLLWVLAVVYLLRVRVVEDEPDTIAAGGPVVEGHVVIGGTQGADGDVTGNDGDPGGAGSDAVAEALTTVVPVVTVADAPVEPPAAVPAGATEVPATTEDAGSVVVPEPIEMAADEPNPATGRGRRGRRRRGRYAR